MKQDYLFHRALSVLCLLVFVLAACAPAATQPTVPDAEEPVATDPSAAQPEATEAAAGEPVTLTYLVDDSEANQASAKALADAYMALHPNVTIVIESRPGGTDGDNIVKTRLATGEMTDIFWYNSGS